jgi:hypothetical protein
VLLLSIINDSIKILPGACVRVCALFHEVVRAAEQNVWRRFEKDVLARLRCAMKAGDNLCSIKLPQKTQEAHSLI